MNSELLSIMLALAATMLALSILVQIVQEVYKYLGSSKERAYTNALLDFLGPWASQILEPGRVMKLQIRGPMQLFRFRPPQRLLPMEKPELISALESTSSTWVRRTLEKLRLEVEFQQGNPALPSPTWRSFLGELGHVEKGTAGYWTAYQVASFLQNYGHRISNPVAPGANDPNKVSRIGTIAFEGLTAFNAAEALIAFRQQFLAHVVHAEEQFNLLQRNFDYQYGRRNLRQTFSIALVVALLFNLSLQRLYNYAKAVPPEDAAQLAQSSLDLYQKYRTSHQAAGSNEVNQGQTADSLQWKQLLAQTQEIMQQSKGLAFGFVDIEDVASSIGSFLKYLLGCFFTALLLSFGAPIWNDIASALLNIQRSRKQQRQISLNEAANG